MSPQDIHNLWEVDSEINGNELAQESMNIPQLHSKYLKFLSEERQELKRLRYKSKQVQLEKMEYFTGRMSTSKLQQKNLKPFPHKILKNEVDDYVQADKEVIEMRLRIDEKQECVDVLESIIDQINKRTFVIGNAIKWNNFVNGIA